ncbi:MAG: ComF family protein [Clostridia bacterium]|nr:ComF family protein [Clostridia bacterium]
MFKDKLIKFKNFLLDMVYPNDIKCMFCDNDVANGCICDECLKENIFNEGNRCIKCDAKIKEGNIVCDHCKNHKRYFEQCFCPFDYTGKVRASILKFKSDGAKYLAEHFVKFIYEKLMIENVVFDVIVPVPSHTKTIKKRGYNPAKVLADELAKLSNKPVCDVLCKNQPTQNQKFLNFEERQNNLKDSISLTDSKSIKGKNVLIIDDVVTTCATVNTCAKLMDKAGFVYVCAIARTNF